MYSSRAEERFFLPSQQFPVDMRDPADSTHQKCAAMALYAENLNRSPAQGQLENAKVLVHTCHRPVEK